MPIAVPKTTSDAQCLLSTIRDTLTYSPIAYTGAPSFQPKCSRSTSAVANVAEVCPDGNAAHRRQAVVRSVAYLIPCVKTPLTICASTRSAPAAPMRALPPRPTYDVCSEREAALFRAVADARARPEKIAPRTRCLVNVRGDLIVLRMHGEAAGAADADDQPVGGREQMREIRRKGREKRSDGLRLGRSRSDKQHQDRETDRTGSPKSEA